MQTFSDKDITNIVMSELMNRYQKKFFSVILAYSNYDYNISEEILQESWIQILNSLDTFNYKQKFFPWAFTIVLRTSQKIIHKNKKYINTLDNFEENKNKILNQDKNIEEALIDKEEKYILNKILHTLSEEEYLCIYFKFFENAKISEIMKITNKSRSTVFEIINRAKKKIKEQILQENTNYRK